MLETYKVNYFEKSNLLQLMLIFLGLIVAFTGLFFLILKVQPNYNKQVSFYYPVLCPLGVLVVYYAIFSKRYVSIFENSLILHLGIFSRKKIFFKDITSMILDDKGLSLVENDNTHTFSLGGFAQKTRMDITKALERSTKRFNSFSLKKEI